MGHRFLIGPKCIAHTSIKTPPIVAEADLPHAKSSTRGYKITFYPYFQDSERRIKIEVRDPDLCNRRA